MSGYLFSALLLLLLFSCVLCAADTAGTHVELFTPKTTEALKSDGTLNETLDILQLFIPSFTVANDVMVGYVYASVGYGNGYILTKYFQTGGERWAERAIEEDGKNWKAQWAVDNQKKGMIFASVAKNNTIYVLSASKINFSTPQEAWSLELIMGNVTDGVEGAKKILWKTKNVEERLTQAIQQKFKNVDLSHRAGFLTEDNTAVFVFGGRNNADLRDVFVIAHSKDPNTDLTFHFREHAAECSTKFFSWGTKLYMVLMSCRFSRRGTHKVLTSDDMGQTWEDGSGWLAKELEKGEWVMDFYTPITIGGRRVLLFAELKTWDGYIEPADVNLFMAYDNHTTKVGRILTDVSWAIHGTFVYTNDELFFLIHRSARTQGIFLMRLKDQLEEIKRLLEDWPPRDSSIHERVSV